MSDDKNKSNKVNIDITEDECEIVKDKILKILDKLPTSAAKSILKNLHDKIDFVSIVSSELFPKS